MNSAIVKDLVDQVNAKEAQASALIARGICDGPRYSKVADELENLTSRLHTARQILDQARVKMLRDPYQIQEAKDILLELDALQGSHPHAFELCIDKQAIQRVIDTIQDEIYRITDEAQGVSND